MAQDPTRGQVESIYDPASTGRTFPRFRSAVLLPALTVMFGMQVLRVLLPLLVYVLRDRLGFQALHLGIFAVALFSLSFLTGPLLKAMGPRRLAMYAAIGLGATRFAIQSWAWDPVVDLVLAVLATLLFLFYLPAALVLAGRRTAGGGRGSGTTAVYALGILAGFGLDTVLNGLLQTYDLAWRLGWLPVVVVAALALLQGYLALGDRRGQGRGSRVASARGRLLPGPWIAFGPMIVLEMLLFQNVARLGAVTGLSWPAAAVLAGGAHVLGLAVAGWLYVMPGTRTAARGAGGSPSVESVAVIARALAMAAGLLLVLSVIPASAEGFNAGLLYVAGQVSLAYLLMVVVGSVGAGRISAVEAPGSDGGFGRLSPTHGAGMLLLVITLFLTYAGYDIALPFSGDALPPLAALVIAGCGVWAVVGRRRLDQNPGEDSYTVGLPQRAWRLLPALLVAAAVVIPAVEWGMREAPSTSPGAGYPVRVMTFNLHNGFNTEGRLDLEALARVIEKEDPDIVGLQEVSRGWVINGTVDSLAWLEERLGMTAVYGPTAGPLWGNALLTRLPVGDFELASLPTADLLLQRGYIKAAIDVGGGETIDVIATHYHHLDDGGPVRVQESEALLRAWGEAPHTVVLGDLNAGTGDEEIEMLRKSGLIEIVDVAGIVPGHTYSSDDPFERIDYILATGDLAGSGGPAPADVVITSGTASDHLGIAATLSIR